MEMDRSDLCDGALPHPEVEELTLTHVLHALSDPVRLSVVAQLKGERGPEIPCGTFDYNVAKSTFSHHIKVLREAGVLRVRQEGTRSMTSLREADLESRFPGLLAAIMQNV